jgi:excisionase family DNA binding protein
MKITCPKCQATFRLTRTQAAALLGFAGARAKGQASRKTGKLFGRPRKVESETSRTLTTQAAADLLGMSHQFFDKLIKDGAIPFQDVGDRRRVHLRDVIAYQKKRDRARHKVLNELTAEQVAAGVDDSWPSATAQNTSQTKR